ncbi:MAG: RNA pseudouridine synthase [Chitinophagales bacterium]|nr:RNA pseudouridine synthase [Chitinophagales bacterium]
MGNDHQHKLSYFSDSTVNNIALPERFTFPFYYEPHPLTKIAAAELQHYLETQTDLNHNFGLSADRDDMVIGKMFGVLVVEDKEGKIGYLSAFSGKLAGTNDHPRFVPPVFDMLTENSFFLKEQEVISTVNTQIETILSDENYNRLKENIEQLTVQSTEEIAVLKKQLKQNKERRAQLREEKKSNLNAHEYELFDADLIKQSLYDKYLLKLLTEKWEAVIEDIKAQLSSYKNRIDALKDERKERSAILQNQLFEQYTFLNIEGKQKSLQDIFKSTSFGKPPAGAGECATPKLLQYAFANGYKPLAMAEFWWGSSPKSEIRQHKQFYPACTGKCKPILAHMLEGIAVDENPFLLPAKDNISLDIIYEDESLVVVNKPAGLRSVPGIDIDDSVYSRLKDAMIIAEPLVIHRLDMGTSGLLLVAKTPQAHKHIQRQFLNRAVTKRYTALLSKAISDKEGEISLPLIPDLYNRPVQLVCFETGKKSVTLWKVIEVNDDITRIHFWPLTGRTHQLRVHAAHQLGLNAPIVGDDLYGTSDKRLHLHAAYIAFTHPVTKKRMEFEVAEDF